MEIKYDVSKSSAERQAAIQKQYEEFVARERARIEQHRDALARAEDSEFEKRGY